MLVVPKEMEDLAFLKRNLNVQNTGGWDQGRANWVLL